MARIAGDPECSQFQKGERPWGLGCPKSRAGADMKFQTLV